MDTSALAKRYIQEPGSEELEYLFLSIATKVFVSTLALPEFAAALGRKVRDKEILKEHAANALKELEKDWEDLFIKIPLTEEVAATAASLATQHPLKGANVLWLPVGRPPRRLWMRSKFHHSLQYCQLFFLQAEKGFQDCLPTRAKCECPGQSF